MPSVTPPIWLDEARRPCPTVPCPRCGRETPLFRRRGIHFARQPDWRPFQVERHPSWCGHPIPKVSIPIGGGGGEGGPVLRGGPGAPRWASPRATPPPPAPPPRPPRPL